MGRGRGDSEVVAITLATLRNAPANDPDALAQAVDEAKAELGEAMQRHPHYSKTEAARMFEVSRPTLDKWIDQGLLPTVEVPGRKLPHIPAKPLLLLVGQVRWLRKVGRRRDLLAEAMLRLDEQDPEWQAEFEELYGPGLRLRKNASRDEYVSAAPGEDWDPED